MKNMTLVTGLAFALMLPTVAVAKPSPDGGDKRAAKAECKTLRGQTAATREAFRALQRSFVACVKAKAVEEAKEGQSAHKNASQECREERAAGVDAFNALYGKNANGRNAFGKCVSQKAREKEAAADEQDAEDAADQKSAAKECATERSAGEDAFAEEYGTNANNRNAFGKCVSQTVREDDEETPPVV